MNNAPSFGLLSIAISACAVFASASIVAQYDINAILQKQGTGMRMEDDNDPFVANEFTGSFSMEMHLFDGPTEMKESPMNLRYWSSENKMLVQMSVPGQGSRDVKMMTDLEGKWQYMLMTDTEGKRMAMKSRKKKMVLSDSLRKEQTGKPETDITITNEKKTIEGRTCTKVIGKSEDGLWTGWVARDLKGPYADMAKHIRASDAAMNKHMMELPGFALEFEWAPTDGKNRIVCYIKDLVPGTVDTDVFSIDGYEMIQIPGK
ncbi:MAG: hypothetical protein ABI599_06435 [Flavobacteriales bacterium]